MVLWLFWFYGYYGYFASYWFLLIITGIQRLIKSKVVVRVAKKIEQNLNGNIEG
jgi:hypothetical protein